jgi:hypothetical protein
LTLEEKAKKFDEIQAKLWDLARHGSLGQSTFAATFIRLLEIESPEGDDPESA